MTADDERRRQWAWVAAALVLVPSVVFLQQFGRGLRETTLERAPPERLASERLLDPGVSDLTVASKYAAKVAYYGRTEGETGEDPIAGEAMAGIDSMAVSRPERLRAAIVAGDLLGAEVAQQRIAALTGEAEPDGDLARELHWLTVLYADGRAAVPVEAQESIVDRHGWFGRLALSHDMPDSDPYRRKLLGGIERVGWFNIWLTLGSVIALIVGLFGLGALWSGRRHGVLERGFAEAAGNMPGLIGLEIFVVFAAAFLVVLGLGLVPFGLGAEASAGALVFDQFLLWSLVGVVAWPVIRGVPWRDFAPDLGLTPGKGVLFEMACGLLGYLAGLPLFIGAAIVSSIIEAAIAGDAPGSEAPSHPLIEAPAIGSWFLLFLGSLSAVIWAPVVEEYVLRGGLYRWARAWARPWLAVPITAVVFGLIHPYTPLGLIPIAVGGLMFGALREWRGSLIAPVTAHFLHNGTITLVTIGYLVALGD